MNLYFNNAFAKQPLEETIAAMRPFLRDEYENPLTESDGAGTARKALQDARGSVAALLGAAPGEVVFVSSGTEANNWALKGAVAASRTARRHIVISAVEHFSVLQTALFLSRQGVDVTIVPVDGEGRLDPGEVARSMRPETIVVSVIAGSDEIGVTQDLEAIAALKSRFPDVLLHTDAVSYLCYEKLDTRRLRFDLVSMSSNAIFGPAGIAALYVRDGTRLVPLLHGGMQEDGMRPGLQSIALAVGFGEAARRNVALKAAWRETLALRQAEMLALFDDLKIPVTGSRGHRMVDNVHGIVDVDGEALLTLLVADGIQASTGSTCYQYAQKESHVLKSLGVSEYQSRGAVLFTGSIYQDAESVRELGRCLKESLLSLRALRPW